MHYIKPRMKVEIGLLLILHIKFKFNNQMLFNKSQVGKGR